MWRNLFNNTIKVVGIFGTGLSFASYYETRQANRIKVEKLIESKNNLETIVQAQGEETIKQNTLVQTSLDSANSMLEKGQESFNQAIVETGGETKKALYDRGMDCISNAQKEIDKIVKFIDNNKFLDNIYDFFSKISTKFNDYLGILNSEQLLALGNLLASITIFYCLFSLFVIFYSDFLIKYFKLEEKHSKLAKFILIRRKLNQYYFGINLFIIFVLLLILIFFNLTAVLVI